MTRIIRKTIAAMIMLSMTLALTACGKEKIVKECTWGEEDFKIKYVKTTESESGDKAVIRLKIVMDKDGMPVDFFEKNVEDGNLKIKDEKPSQFYNYTKTKQGNIAEANMSFFMPKDYVFDANDIIVNE